jgi:hypothetical protein
LDRIQAGEVLQGCIECCPGEVIADRDVQSAMGPKLAPFLPAGTPFAPFFTIWDPMFTTWEHFLPSGTRVSQERRASFLTIRRYEFLRKSLKQIYVVPLKDVWRVRLARHAPHAPTKMAPESYHLLPSGTLYAAKIAPQPTSLTLSGETPRTSPHLGSQIFPTSKFSPTFWLTTQRRSLAKDGPYCRRPASLSTAKSTTGLPGQGSRKPISRGNSQTLRRPPRLWLTHRGLSDSGCPAAWPPWSRHSGAGQWRSGTGPAGSIMVGEYGARRLPRLGSRRSLRQVSALRHSLALGPTAPLLIG